MKKANLKQRFCSKGGVTVFLLAGIPVMYGAESVINTSAPVDTTPSWSEQESTNNEMEVFTPATAARRSSSEPFVLGPLTFRPHLTYDITYATGIQINTSTNISQPGTNTAPQSTIMQTFSPGLTLDIGSHVTLDYSPSFLFYSNRKFKNSSNQSASLAAATDYDDWAFQLTQTYTEDTSALSETAQQTRTTDFNTALAGTYTINDKWSSQLGVDQDFNYVKGFDDSKTWSTMDWLDYSFWTRFSGGIGAGAGYIHLDTDPDTGTPIPNSPGDQIYETMQLKVNWRATDKFSLSANGGFQNTKYGSSPNTPAITSLSPIFGGSIEYQPFKYTQLSLTASRSISSSDYVTASQAETATTFNLSLTQRLLEKFYLALGAGYTETEFSQSESLGPLHANNDRTDHDYTFSARLSRNILKRGNIALHYQYSAGSSTQTGFGSDSSQVGVEVGYSY